MDQIKMDEKQQSHCWWFDSHNSLNCSTWLQSTLSELNEKTKTMLKLVEDDADSFAQRAEMYYKKRPELISMVEDFYRAYRSLAERYDQLKCDRSRRVRSPLRHSLPHPKDEHENLFDSLSSLKSLDSFTEVTYSSDESVDSEVDDPELEGDSKEKRFPALDAGSDELIKLREEVDRLREENEIQKMQMRDSNLEKEELLGHLADNINELKKLRQECEAINGGNSAHTSYDMKDGERVLVAKKFESMQELGNMQECEAINGGNSSHTSYDMKDGERVLVVKKFESMQELGNMEAENRHLKDALVLKEILLKHEEDEKTKVTRILEEAQIELLKLREDAQRMGDCLNETLAVKDEEKREVIRQLSIAMDILREDNRFLKKSIVKRLPKKGCLPFLR